MTIFDKYLNETKEYGIAEIVKYPIIECSGLPSVRIGDLIMFETGQQGQVVSLGEHYVEVVTFSSEKIIPGKRVVRTGQKLMIEVGDHYLGQIVDPLGNFIFQNEKVNKAIKAIKSPERRDIDPTPPAIETRKRITRQLITGISVIDVVLPLARGQRELVVGDRQTGKTWALINIAKSQTSLGAKVVYCLIGKEKSEITRIKSYMEKSGILENVLMVVSSSDDSPSLISMTPYSGMTHAEYFRDSGKDVVIIMDDLTTHAMYYREMSLISKRFPGRDSYPGDIFFKHARLLERAGNFKFKDNESSITALPVAGTVNNMLTSHIVSNLIGITDGHLLFDADLFNRGRRPSINIFLSVTRVGKQTQTKLLRSLSRDMMLNLTKYEEVLEFSHFGAELSEDKKMLLKRGEKIYKFFEQVYTVVIPIPMQILFLGLLNAKILDDIDLPQIVPLRRHLIQLYETMPDIKTKIDTFVSSYEKVDDLYTAIEEDKEFFHSLCKKMS